MITVKHLSVKRSKKTILSDISFEAPSGAVTVIAGPNGSGKTTLLKALAQELGYGGDIYFNGVNLKTMKPWQRASMRGILPQISELLFPFLVSEVVALGLQAGNAMVVEGRRSQNIIIQALDKVGLGGYATRFYQELSGGEQARVQLARVLSQVWYPMLNDLPCWLLLDEPIAALDVDHQLTVMNLARHFADSGGGVLTTLHDLNIAARFADKIIFMKKGQIFASGTVKAIMTSATLSALYQCEIPVNQLPTSDIPFVLPQTIQRASPKPKTNGILSNSN